MSAPAFPDFKPVGLEDRDLFAHYLERFPTGVCELSFANIFIWRSIEKPRWTIDRDRLCILVDPPGEPAYALPPLGTGPLRETVEDCLSLVPRLSRVPADLARSLAADFRTEPDPANFDYVYRAADLAELKGKKYDGKRNRIRKFEREHRYRYVEVCGDCLGACRRLLDEWLEAKAGNGWDLEAQRAVVGEALVHFNELGLRGGGIEVEGRLAAFSIGGRLDRQTAVVMIEIVDPAFDGLAQLMNREFVRNAWAGFPFVNREQDLGLEGLRRAKQSYHPDHLVEKFNLTGLARG
jgi:hypothetical protein